jgi:chemotaxis protein MotB
MAKRKKSVEEEHVNHERWLVSYADFITLLFAFFVVMYAISSVNEGKYRVLAETMATAFNNPNIARSPEPIQVGEIQRSGGSVIEMVKSQQASDTTKPVEIDPEAAEEAARTVAQQTQLDNLFQEIQAVLAPYISEQVITVAREADWIEVDMKSSLLFGSGSADLSPAALPALHKVAELLRNTPNAVHVEGHTDDVPINTVQFPSNWELSAARAASVVHEFMRNGVDPGRMAAIGYSQYQPAAGNDTDEGRNQNRRVVLILLPEGQVRHKKTLFDAVRLFERGFSGNH